jgi:imidazoleglycerol phosphate dehydratase HisB
MGRWVQDWLEGASKQVPVWLSGRDAVVWSREYSRTKEEHCNCEMLQKTLNRLGADRMVVGHTIQQEGVNAACADQVVRCVRA